MRLLAKHSSSEITINYADLIIGAIVVLNNQKQKDPDHYNLNNSNIPGNEALCPEILAQTDLLV